MNAMVIGCSLLLYLLLIALEAALILKVAYLSAPYYPKPSVLKFAISVVKICRKNRIKIHDFLAIVKEKCDKTNGPTVLEFIISVQKNGLKSELEFLALIASQGGFEKIVGLAFRYQRSHNIYC